MRPALRLLRVKDTAALEALAPAWWDLWRCCPGATPFQSPAWLLSWWRVFAPGRLFVLAAFAADRLVALLPTYIEDGPFGRRVLPIGISLSDYLDLLVDPPCEPEALDLLAQGLSDASDLWDTLDWEEAQPEAAALRLPDLLDCDSRLAAQSACPVLALPKSTDELDRHVPARKLRKLRMSRNRASRRSGVEVWPLALADADRFLSALLRLHGARWNSRGEAGVLADDAVQRFHARALPALAAAGLARGYGLTIEGEVAGAYYGFAHGRRAYAYLGGFDPAFAFESPGTLLMGHAIEEAVREGCTEFHFLRGQEAYKYEWGAVDRWNQRRSMRRAEPRRAHG